MDCDVLVIGSGFGGSVVALRAAQSGRRVIVLERGPYLTEEAYQRLARGRGRLLDVRREQSARQVARRPAAALELLKMPGLIALCGSAVGGGSLHYTSVTMPAPPQAFADGWPSGWTAESMTPYYQRVTGRLLPGPAPYTGVRTQAMLMAGIRMGCAAARTPLALDYAQPAPRVSSPRHAWRSDLVDWMRGDGAYRKRTLVEAFLVEAARCGAAIRPTCAATRVGAARDGYVVEFLRRDAGRLVRGELRTRRLVMAAGTLNTVRLLLEARERWKSLPQLSASVGRGFSTNGDCGALLIGPRLGSDYAASPIATAWIDCFARDGLMMMDLGSVPLFRRIAARVLPPLLRLRDRGRSDAGAIAWIVGVMGQPSQTGRLWLDWRGRMRHVRPGDDGGFHARARLCLRELAAACGATLLAPPAWLMRRFPMTVHPLGGCGLADSPERGVCGPTGEAFGHRGLFVADGSALPRATGCPPSMTIAAAAERISEGIVNGD